jgi:acetolactate synthase I/II/III large subunit
MTGATVRRKTAMSTAEDQGATTTVGSALAAGLARAGVKIAFTVPGESVLGLLEGLAEHRIRVVGARHEGAAAFMAEAVAQLTGRPALCVAGRAPGAANLAIGLQAAMADSAPVVAIVGQVRRSVRGREAFQEMEIARTFEPFVKWAGEIHDAAEAGPMLEKALLTAVRGRPGPVVLAVPSDLFDEVVPADEHPGGAAAHPEYHAEPDPTLVRKVLHLLADGQRPLILAGAGVLRARSTDALIRFAETLRIPVVASWRRPDVFPNDNPLYLGMTGIGAAASVRARIEDSDALLVLGSRLGEHTTYGYALPGPGTKWAHVDAEPRSAANGHKADIVMAADVAAFLRVAQRLLARAVLESSSLDARTAANAIDRGTFDMASDVGDVAWDGPGVNPGRVVRTLAEVLPHDAILTTDAGDFGTWAARGYRFHRPGTFIGSTAGPMGYGLPAAIGATLARPGRLGVALAGDGGFAMTMAELETAVRERAHVIALVFDNGRLGTIWRYQAERASGEGVATRLGPIDFAAVAEAAGVSGYAVRTDDEFEPALRRAIESGRPALIHLELDPAWTLPGIEPVRKAAVEVGAAVAVEQSDPAGEPAEVPETGPVAARAAEPEARISEVEALGMFQAQAIVELMAERYGSPGPAAPAAPEPTETAPVVEEAAVETVEAGEQLPPEPDAPEQPAG